VAQLVSLVGGSAKKFSAASSSGKRRPSEKIKPQLRVPKEEALKKHTAACVKREARPEHLIPLDDDDFKDF